MNLNQLLNEDKPNVDSLKDTNLSVAFDDALRQVNEVDPNYAKIAKALSNVGEAYDRLKNYDQALKYYQLALEYVKQALELQQALHEEEDYDKVAQALYGQ